MTLSVGTQSRNEDCVRRFLRPCEKNKTGVMWHQFSQNTKLSLECVFMLLTDKSEFTSAIVCHLPLWKNMFSPCASCLCWFYILLITLLNPWSINCLEFWIKLAIACDPSLTHVRPHSPRLVLPTKVVNICPCPLGDHNWELAISVVMLMTRFTQGINEE
jgi:hypothetical protein